jgi:hypothetical protein
VGRAGLGDRGVGHGRARAYQPRARAPRLTRPGPALELAA